MIREALRRTFGVYPSAREEKFAQHPDAQWIRDQLPAIFREAMPEFSDLIWAASPGQGRWADAPWIAAFDPLVTDTPQKGWYPVYLFNRPMNAVYLSLNQGMSRLRAERGAHAKETLAYRASILRTRVAPAYKERFSSAVIDLEPSNDHSRLAYYQSGHAFGKRYSLDHLPSQKVFKDDLAEILYLYGKATARPPTAIWAKTTLKRTT